MNSPGPNVMLPRPAVDDDDADIEEDLVPDGTDAIEVRLFDENRNTSDELEHVDHVDEIQPVH